ncbi:MAG: OmpH family outer membrane protein [Rubripirellula sp.]
MRSFGKSAIMLAIITTTALVPALVSAQTAQPASASTGHRVAVVDVAYIFKTHPGIRAEVSKVENDLKAFDAQMKAKQGELKQLAEKLPQYKIGTPEYGALEQQIAEGDSQLRIQMTSKRRELADAEARIYYQNYERITAGVKVMADFYKINLVLRYNSDKMDLEKPDTVIRGVMKNIVYHDEDLDMTKAIMQYLTKQMEQQATAPTPGVQRN